MSNEDKQPKACGCMGPCGQPCEYADWRERQENKPPHNFCETPEEKCTMNYCDENGCQNRERHLVSENKQLPTVEEFYLKKVFPYIGVNEETQLWLSTNYTASTAVNIMEEYKDLHTAPLREELEKLRAENERLKKEIRDNEGANRRDHEYARNKKLENQKLREALLDLYLLKQHKDNFGKDRHYIKHIPLAWNKAKEALKGGKNV